MINLKVFCPYERIASIVNKIAFDNGCDRVMIAWDEIGRVSEFPVAKRLADRSLGFSIADRRRALSVDEVTALVYFDDKQYSLVCTNDMAVEALLPQSAMINGKKQYNSLLVTGDRAVCPEAFRTTAFNILDISGPVDDPDNAVSSVRPFYQYLLEEVDTTDKIIRIHGPSNKLMGLSVHAVVDSEFGKFALLGEKRVSSFVDVDQKLAPKLDQRGYRKIGVMLDYGEGRTQPYVVKQDILTIRGVPLSCVASLEILRLIAYLEMSPVKGFWSEAVDKELGLSESGVVTVPIVQVAGHYIIEPSYRNKLIQYVSDAVAVKQIFDSYVASDDEFLVRRSDGIHGMLMSNIRAASSCFAFAFTAAVCLDRLPTCSFFELLTTLISNGIIRIEDGVLTGYTKSGDIAQNGIDLTLPVTGVRLTGLKRTVLGSESNVAVRNKRYIVGADFRQNKDSASGAPDHYLLGRFTDDGLQVDFDPLASAGRNFGYLITGFGQLRDREIGEVTYELTWV